MPRLRIATYNIHKGVTRSFIGLTPKVRIHEIRTRLRGLQPDLLFLQEVQGRHEHHAKRLLNWPEMSQVEFLADEGGYHTAYGRAATYLHGDHGNALLSKLRIDQIGELDVSDHAMEKRGILHCQVDLSGEPLHCFVVHLGLLGRSRLRQADALINWVGEVTKPTDKLLIAGDFNDWRNVLTERLQKALRVTDVFDEARPDRIASALNSVGVRLQEAGIGAPNLERATKLLKRRRAARTFPSVMPLAHLDRIYQRGFQVDSAKVVSGIAWARLSDHAPLVAELSF